MPLLKTGVEMPTEEQIKEWQDTIRKIVKVEEYNKTRRLYWSIISQIERLTEDIGKFQSPRNPRQDAIQMHDRATLYMLEKQKDRLEKKMSELEQSIKKDIEDSKVES